jgi:hypothetical protein
MFKGTTCQSLCKPPCHLKEGQNSEHEEIDELLVGTILSLRSALTTELFPEPVATLLSERPQASGKSTYTSTKGYHSLLCSGLLQT